MFTSEKMVKFLREKYPPGTRIRLVSMEDPYAPVAPGTAGTLVCVDDAGTTGGLWPLSPARTASLSCRPNAAC